MRLQLAINVTHLDAAIDFYRNALGAELNKREAGYANLVLAEPALKLVLFETDDVSDRLNHLGFEVFDDEQVEAAKARLTQAGIENEVQQEEVCCFAKQNKVVAYDPDGTMWEWYRVLEDSPSFFAEPADTVAEAVTEPATGLACCASAIVR
jgi:catechol 2,3-dioxygenase-like lactoylglutathione lyase family enzyme